MPRISDEAKETRREQILDGARRCFGQFGYEGATVKRLEEAIGLSRGAIFNYFPTKEDLFLELFRRDNQHLSQRFAVEGLEGVVDEVLGIEPEWYAVYLEFFRRARTDEAFKARVHELTGDIIVANRARFEQLQQEGALRDDLTTKELGSFFNVVLNGLAVLRAGGDETPDRDLVLRLLRDAIGGRAPTRTRRRTPA